MDVVQILPEQGSGPHGRTVALLPWVLRQHRREERLKAPTSEAWTPAPRSIAKPGAHRQRGVLLKTVDPALDCPGGDKQALGYLGHVVTGTQPEQCVGSLEGSGGMGTAGHHHQWVIFFVGKGHLSHRRVLVFCMAIDDPL
jgi:hypothetical protein